MDSIINDENYIKNKQEIEARLEEHKDAVQAKLEALCKRYQPKILNVAQEEYNSEKIYQTLVKILEAAKDAEEGRRAAIAYLNLLKKGLSSIYKIEKAMANEFILFLMKYGILLPEHIDWIKNNYNKEI